MNPSSEDYYNTVTVRQTTGKPNRLRDKKAIENDARLILMTTN